MIRHSATGGLWNGRQRPLPRGFFVSRTSSLRPQFLIAPNAREEAAFLFVCRKLFSYPCHVCEQKKEDRWIVEP